MKKQKYINIQLKIGGWNEVKFLKHFLITLSLSQEGGYQNYEKVHCFHSCIIAIFILNEWEMPLVNNISFLELPLILKKKKKIIQSQQFQSLEVDQQNFKTNKKMSLCQTLTLYEVTSKIVMLVPRALGRVRSL